MSLGALGHLGTTLGSQRLTCAFQGSILEDFSSKWGPHSEPQNHTGVFQVGIGACIDMCFRIVPGQATRQGSLLVPPLGGFGGIVVSCP